MLGAGHEDAEAFWREGAGQQDLAADETEGQYKGPFVLPDPGPPSPAPCHSEAGIQKLIDVTEVWHDFAMASEGSGSEPASVGRAGAPRVLFCLQRKGRSWANPRHVTNIERLPGKGSSASLATISPFPGTAAAGHLQFWSWALISTTTAGGEGWW